MGVRCEPATISNVSTKVAVGINRSPSPPPQSPHPRNRPAGNGSQDDAIGILGVAFVAFAFAGYFYLRYFDVVTFVSRTACFAAASYALLGCAVDMYRRSVLLDQIQWGYLLAGLASGVAAGLLLQAQALVTPEMLEAAAAEQGAVQFFLHRLTNAGRLYVIASLACTSAICFVILASLLAILRALLLAWTDDESRGWSSRILLGATEWVQPVPFAIMSLLGLGFSVFLLYGWLPNALRI